MASQTPAYRRVPRRSSGAAALVFAVGALIALVCVLAYVVFGSGVDVSPRSDAPVILDMGSGMASGASSGT